MPIATFGGTAAMQRNPTATNGRLLNESAEEVNVVGVTIAGISELIRQDGQKVSVAFIATSDQAIKVVDETEKTLARLKIQDPPKAIADLKATSDNPRSISTQVDTVSNASVVTLVVGLLLARSHDFGSGTDKATAIIKA